MSKWHLYIAADTLICGTRGDVLFTEVVFNVTCKKCIKKIFRLKYMDK